MGERNAIDLRLTFNGDQRNFQTVLRKSANQCHPPRERAAADDFTVVEIDSSSKQSLLWQGIEKALQV